MLRTRLLPLAAVVSAILPQFAYAHGYMDYPPARQEVCDRDGGYWESTDGSTIPNAACRAAFKESGWFPFVQKPEFAKQISDYNNQAAVEAALPDGVLCSAGDPKKAGIDIPSPDWQATPIDPSLNGKLTLLYRATTPHSPSFWKIYLSNASYNPATAPLKWTDLDLVAEFKDIPIVVINEKKYYQMTVNLPTGRTGNAVLYTRWQRNDPGGEGFYNCSDISFGGDVVTSTWQGIGGLVKATDDANAGDTVWFRVFNSTGTETVFEKLAIDAGNQEEGTWAAQLAETINTTSADVRIGKLGEDGTVTWDAADLYSNLVFVKDKNATFQLDIKGSGNAGNDTNWDASATYLAGDKVTHLGTTYTAQWWNQGEEPGTAAVWVTEAAEAVGESGDSKAWNQTLAYSSGDVVAYEGRNYKAKWWTKGEIPTNGGPWESIK